MNRMLPLKIFKRSAGKTFQNLYTGYTVPTQASNWFQTRATHIYYTCYIRIEKELDQ